MHKKVAWKTYDAAALEELEALSVRYRDFLDQGKTEREVVRYITSRAQALGFKTLEEARAAGGVKPGDRIIHSRMGKILMLAVIGTEPMAKGFNFVGAHIDSPRLDVKQNPLYEDGGMAYLDTHYYGGIKKYQWIATPLALHGVIAKKDGTVVPVCFGEDPAEPVLVISDLLIHLAGKQMEKKGAVVIEGEDLNVIVGGRPLDGAKEDEKEAVKKNILAILKEKYGVEEEDFLSAELEVVPAGHARELGLDASMILAYGQDDRVCAFAQWEAILQVEKPKYTSLALFTDKEEIGSVGATGSQSRFFENTVAELMDLAGEYSELALRRALENTCVLSADVTAGFDPIYANAFEKNNAAFIGSGIGINKYTGSRGKSGSNDANAEYLARVRKCFDDAGVDFQLAELGKVDQGGGGTIAYIVANYGAEVVDCGVALLSMHAPYEVSSKADVYEAMKAYRAFYMTMDR